jgi:hypothetical protein
MKRVRDFIPESVPILEFNAFLKERSPKVHPIACVNVQDSDCSPADCGSADENRAILAEM